MAKTSIHPEWYPNAKVYCDGQLIMKVGSTQPKLNVDIWSGNHPFYTGSQKILDTDCLLYTSPSPRDAHESRMPSSA